MGLLLTFPLGATAVRVDICLNEPDVTLYNRADVLYPVSRTLLVSFNGTALESERDQNPLRLLRTRTKAPTGTYDAIYSPIIALWCSLATYFLA